MIILAINCGSTSLKYQLINDVDEKVMAKGYCERIGIDGHFVYQPTGGKEEVRDYYIPTHREAVMLALYSIKNKKTGVISSLDEIDAVGHRIAHGGEQFKDSALITGELLKTVKEFSELAPLHNPVNLLGISVCREFMPRTPMVGVFDTAFHQTMPKRAFLYPLPYEYYEKYGIRKYGFHGPSHKYVSEEMADFLGLKIKHSKEIICHLGSDASISAVLNGECIDTSMGFTPLAGLGMGTRSGDLDPSIVAFLAAKLHVSVNKIMDILNQRSGVYGLSGAISSDFRELEAAAGKGNANAELALDLFSYRVALTIGAYATAMKGVDAIAFTAGIGERDPEVRKRICSYLEYLGLRLDLKKNRQKKPKMVISAENSTISVCVISTNEELEISRETVRILNHLKDKYTRRSTELSVAGSSKKTKEKTYKNLSAGRKVK